MLGILLFKILELKIKCPKCNDIFEYSFGRENANVRSGLGSNSVADLIRCPSCGSNLRLRIKA